MKWFSVARVASRRTFSTQAPIVGVSVDDKSGIATVTLQRPPVNSINLELATSLKDAILDLEKNRSRGIILTSAQPTVFSAGLDILEMYKPDPERVKEFWVTLQDLWLTLFGSKTPTAAAINGHSPAGGCLLACSCEYRVMVHQEDKKFSIGLNETKLGIIAPPWFIYTYQNTLDRRTAESALTLGKLFPVKEALAVGLVDEVATDKQDAIDKATKWLLQFNNISPAARAITKLSLRGDALQWLKKNKQPDLDQFISTVTSPQVQAGLEMYLQALKRK